MEFLAEIFKTSISKVSCILIMFTGTICAGLLILFHFYSEYFISFDIVKLVFLSSSITFPIYFINMLIYTFPYLSSSYRTANFKNNEDMLNTVVIIGALYNTAILYIALFLSWNKSYDINNFIKVIIITELFAVADIFQSLVKFHLSNKKLKLVTLKSYLICYSGFFIVVFLFNNYFRSIL